MQISANELAEIIADIKHHGYDVVTLHRVMELSSDRIKRDNPQFDKMSFYKRCGFHTHLAETYGVGWPD